MFARGYQESTLVGPNADSIRPTEQQEAGVRASEGSRQKAGGSEKQVVSRQTAVVQLSEVSGQPPAPEGIRSGGRGRGQQFRGQLSVGSLR